MPASARAEDRLGPAGTMAWPVEDRRQPVQYEPFCCQVIFGWCRDWLTSGCQASGGGSSGTRGRWMSAGVPLDPMMGTVAPNSSSKRLGGAVRWQQAQGHCQHSMSQPFGFGAHWPAFVVPCWWCADGAMMITSSVVPPACAARVPSGRISSRQSSGRYTRRNMGRRFGAVGPVLGHDGGRRGRGAQVSARREYHTGSETGQPCADVVSQGVVAYIHSKGCVPADAR